MAGIDALSSWVFSSLLLSLRISPLFAFAPPFTLTRMPVLFRVLLGVGAAACMTSLHPAVATMSDYSLGNLVVVAARELLLGLIFVVAFQLMFGALYMAGRVIDIQAGFGLAMLIDPTSNAQTPLVGTLFAYAAAAVFFALGGHQDLLRLIAASLQAVPLGAAYGLPSVAHIAGVISVVFVTALGVGGGTILCLFLADAAIAMLSRTVPQMNVLVLGFQVKTILLLLVLPTAFGVAGALLARICALTLEAIPGLL